MNPHAHSLGKPLLSVVLITAIGLLIPLLAMQFTPGVAWTVLDFGTAAALLLGAGSSMVIVFKRVSSRFYRGLLIALIALALAIVWIELAVGLFHSFTPSA
ncbi:hypothetical protein [Geothrix sp.]|jgi:hypothetical protein|uniref:hypothetical protein n=1 Tax=Geothrix sp. TaxID=1962974 RepID=UPI0025C5BE16|nr:hypothetical protein [Geothrix sp.]